MISDLQLDPTQIQHKLPGLAEQVGGEPERAGVPGFAESLAVVTDDDPAGELDRAAAEQTKQQEELREAAEQLVATGFVQPLMAQMRDDPFRTELFHGGTAEDMFAQQLDVHLSEEIVGGMNFPLVDAIERFMADGSMPKPQTTGQQVNLHG